MSDTGVRKHPFHIVDPSPWPALGSLAALIAAIGLVQYMHDSPPWVMLTGLALIVVTMFGWWRDVILEAVRDRAHTGPVRRGLRMGFALFIGSEVMFFAGFFWAYFHNAMHYNPVLEGVWPPEGIETMHAVGLPLINTIILISSGFVLMWARKGLDLGQRGRLTLGLVATVVLGVAFLVLQAIEYGEAAFSFTEGIYPSVFYMATGFHGFHVFVGVCMLAVMAARSAKGHFTAEHHVGLEAAEWYWHFVDVVWVFLFVFFYWWIGF